MSEQVRLAVVGAGSMGANHIRVAQQLPGVRLVAVVDQDLERARAVAGSANVEVVGTVAELTAEVDAAVVAVPTNAHLPVATELAARGIHLLVEKPLAGSVEEAEALVATARAAGVILAVGHVERFNPAVFELPRLLDAPIHFEASRISPFTARIGDGVIFDLMIHDIDIVCSLVTPGAEVVQVAGVSRAAKGPTEDLASVTMAFSTGETAVFNTSRLGQRKIRTLEITQAESSISVDLLRQDITISRMSQQEYLSEGGAQRFRQSSVVEIPFLETRGEPLARELEHFLDCVRRGLSPMVDGVAGARAVALAQRAAAAVHEASDARADSMLVGTVRR
jgi:predicted dehydrogenase